MPLGNAYAMPFSTVVDSWIVYDTSGHVPILLDEKRSACNEKI